MSLNRKEPKSEWVDHSDVEAMVATEEEKSCLREAIDAIYARAQAAIDLNEERRDEAIRREREAQSSLAILRGSFKGQFEALRDEISGLAAEMARSRDESWWSRLFRTRKRA